MSQASNWSLFGCSNDVGVLNVGGRLGAAHGPRAFREALYRLRAYPELFRRLKDFGDSSDLAHEIIPQLKEAHQSTGLSVIVGGGHDFGYSQVKALSELYPKKKIGCINIDAHFDVRKPDSHARSGLPGLPALMTSGSPFYLLLEEGILKPDRFIEFGIQRQANAEDLLNYIQRKKIKTIWYESLRNKNAVLEFKKVLTLLAKKCDLVIVSLDLDAAASAFAPGVSSSQAEGFSSSDIIGFSEVAASQLKTNSLGIFELNPFHDQGNRTALLAATAAHHFLSKRFCFY